MRRFVQNVTGLIIRLDKATCKCTRLINVLAASSINNSVAGSGVYSLDETFELVNGEVDVEGFRAIHLRADRFLKGDWIL